MLYYIDSYSVMENPARRFYLKWKNTIEIAVKKIIIF